VTERVALGTNVLLVALRQWPLLASQLGTIDALHPGRLRLGVGVGGEHPPEWEAAGIPVRERGRRVDEGLAVLAELLAGRPVDHPGPLAPVRSPRIAPVPGRMPPLFVGGRSPAAIERAARVGDGWIGVWLDPDEVAERVRTLRERAAARGRPAPRALFMVFVAVDDDLARARRHSEALFAGQYAMPYEVVERWTATGPPQAVAEFLAPYREAGVEGFILSPTPPDPLPQIELLTEVGSRGE
jgi:alkanesulfonate monooxygenase SsuD/methylene tetrahydromethanopterin reductase-like flavin-dependent oxidoreductase (luciferase family)